MKKRNKKNRNKNTPSNEAPNVSNQYDNVRAKGNRQSKSDGIEEAEAPPKFTPVRFKDLKGVAYRDLFPNKIKKGYEILEALERYDFSKATEKMEPEDSDKDLSDVEETVLKREFKKPKRKLGKAKLKGFSLPRDPIFQLRRAPGPPHDFWFPHIPGLEVPLEDSCEVIGNLNKPWPRDPEEEARRKLRFK